jgi:ArsR family transcriptional regulator
MLCKTDNVRRNEDFQLNFSFVWRIRFGGLVMDVDIKNFELQAEKLKAISHPQRLCIIKGLIDNSCNVTKIQECMKLPQSTVSQHLSKLKAAGIVTGSRKGLEICYSVVDDDVKKIVQILTESGAK